MPEAPEPRTASGDAITEGARRYGLLRWLVLAALAWFAIAAVPTSSAYLAVGSGGISRWVTYFGYIGSYYLIWVLLTPVVYRLATGIFDPATGWLRALLGHLLIYLVMTTGSALLVHNTNWHAWLLGENAPGYFAMSAFSYVLLLLGIHLFYLQGKVREQDAIIFRQQQQKLELQADLARAQLSSLRGQMNPHFLFNALNCIGALIETRQNANAYQALEDLGSLLRTSLEHNARELIPLLDELAFTRRYLDMERTRFGERLQVEFDVEPGCERWPIPPFLLQPLVENAIKHAVAPSRETILISIKVLICETGLAITVRDTGQALPLERQQAAAAAGSTGLGLSNLRQRLALYYGDKGLLGFSKDAEGYTVQIHIPPANLTTEKPKPAVEQKQAAGMGVQLQH